ncbi:hypothetical protein IWW49_004191 [Coemansia sp. RSA 1797]|nr:hypothetical protein IWW49_004191 [Coemansia sp. RSA 1797]
MSQILYGALVDTSRSIMRAGTNSTMAPQPAQDHGLLGDWAIVGYAINICSVVLSIITIVSVIVVLFKNRNLTSHASLRISMASAVCDIIYSVCQMFIFNNEFMSKLPEINLRVFLWMMAGSTVTFVLLTVSMGIHLVLMVLTKNTYWAMRIQPYYEVASFALGFLITHPYMYLFQTVQWVPTAQLFYLVENVSVSRRNTWLIHWAWVFAGIVFLFLITLAVNVQMGRVWRERKNASNTPETVVGMEKGKQVEYSSTKRKYIRSVTFRLSIYQLIPIVTQIMVVVCNFLQRAPFWLFVLANILPTFQGTFNFLAYIVNPALDQYRKRFIVFVFRRNRKPEPEFTALNDTASSYREPSTIRGTESLYSMYKEVPVMQI